MMPPKHKRHLASGPRHLAVDRLSGVMALAILP